MAVERQSPDGARLSGNIIAGELLRNMEVGQFEMAYAVLLPCFFTVYLNPADYARLRGVFSLVSEDARKALRSRVTALNAARSTLTRKRASTAKEYKIACREWDIEFLPDPEVPPGDVEIHSELSETVQPGFRGAKTTLIGRTPSVTQHLDERRRSSTDDVVYGALHYQEGASPQIYLITRNQIRVGRGGDDQPVDLVLTGSDEISREHLVIRRDPATGVFTIVDASTNGTWVNGKRLRKGAEDLLPGRAQIVVGEVLTLAFETRT